MAEKTFENKIKTVLNWSSGKDAAMAYYLLQQSHEYQVTHLLTTINDEHERIVMHGVKEKLLDMQAERMGITLKKIHLPATPDDNTYKNAMTKALDDLKVEGVTTAAFGDIFLEDLRTYREQQLETVGFKAVFPLWKQDTRELIGKLEDIGIRTMIVCVNEKFLGKEFLGRTIDRSFLNDLPDNVDPCGENGEFHTFVYDAPYFKSPIPILPGKVVRKEYMPALNDKDEWNTNFYFLDLDVK